MNFIKKIFDEKIDNSVHLQFQKFGKGEFRNRALIKIKKIKDKYIISTSSEFANELVKICAENLYDNKTQVKGAIISTGDLTSEINFKDKKQFQGVKRYIIEKEMSGEEILELIKKFPKAFFALSFNTDNSQLVIKPKAPKSAKPSNKGKTPKPDFCKLSTNDEKIAKDFVFEKPNFREAEISHTFLIDEIIVLDGLKEEKDYAKVRETAKRKGKIIREALIDGQKIINEKEFVA